MSKQERDACVDAFALVGVLRELVLHRASDREGWRKDMPSALIVRLREEVEELSEAIEDVKGLC